MDSIDQIVSAVLNAIDERLNKKSKSYYSDAEVLRVEGDYAICQLKGGEPETPARMTVDVKKGDTVRVHVDDHKATVTGNLTEKATGDGKANEAKAEAEQAAKKADKAEREAEDAQESADDAQESADNAMTAANGKNKVYIQGTEPTGGTYIENDTWFDTAHDNKIYHYINGAWTPSLLGDDALDTFSANHIVAGSIDASQVTISHLDAGNITSGYLNSARIEAGSLSIGKTSGLQTALDNAGAANSYVTTVSGKTGIAVHMADDTSNYSLMNTAGFYVYQSSEKKAHFSDSGMSLFTYYNLQNREVDVFDINVHADDSYTSAELISKYSSSNYASVNLQAYGTYGAAVLRYRQSGVTKQVSVTANGAFANCDFDVAGNINYTGTLTHSSNNPFKTFTATGTSSSVSAGSGGHITCTGTVPSGYIPIAIIKATTNHTFSGAISHMELTSNGAKLDIINSGSAQSFTGTAVILCTSIQSSTIV